MNLKIILGIILALMAFNGFCAKQEKEILAPEVRTGLRTSIINPITPHLVFKNKDAANAWITDMSLRLKKWMPDDFLRNRYLTIIQYEATRAGLDPQLVLSIITIESKFNKYAISSAGARGMMQIMPFWLAQIGTEKQSLFDVQTNIRYGCTIIRYYIQKEHGNVTRALARYNGSYHQNWYPDKVYAAYNNYWKPAPVLTLKNGKAHYVNYALN
jgi:soluble lytic murein transglycosylase-like protein